MRAIQIALVFVVLASPAMAAGADDYLCIADMATGFKFDPTTKQWRVAQFDVSRNRYIVKLTEKGPTWNEFSSPLPPMQCTAFNESGFTSCSLGGIEEINFNRMNLRFQLVYLSGWVNSDLPPPASLKNSSTLTGLWTALTGKSGNTPLVEIGRCSPL